MSLHKKAFTITELLIVIVIIGILASIGIMSYNVFQEDTRDSRRTANVQVIASSLEKYYETNGEYPSCAALTATPSAVAINTLKGIDYAVLKAPDASSGVENSIVCTDIANSSSPAYRTDSYSYLGSGPACSSGTACTSWVIKYQEERSGSFKEVRSKY